jgi:two-component system phosphate regulon sensor histidine kinase PhoR
MSESYSGKPKDSIHEFNLQGRGHPGEIIRFLYSVDSLQDSLRISEIDSACRLAFRKEGLGIPFTVKKSDSLFRPGRLNSDEQEFRNKITIGFAHPATYEILTGNTYIYLLKRLASPVLFSVFLISITILSFVLLYRNLIKQKKLTEIKNEFISNITHELKTPIATVGVAIEALRNFNAINDPQRTKEYLDISQNELHRLSLLVDKVLKLSMFEKKEVDLKYEPVNIKDVVEEVVSSMKLQIEKNHATVTVNQEGDTSLQGDRLHLVSVIYNLLDNALKYGNGSTEIKIEMKESGDQVMLTISDNGIGIPHEYKDKVFEKFFRIPSGDKHNTKGYGLGLSYVAHVIKKHKGKIEVESQQAVGTKFIITLPKNV